MTGSKGSEGSWDPVMNNDLLSPFTCWEVQGLVLSRLSLQPKDLLGLRSISAHTRMAVQA